MKAVLIWVHRWLGLSLGLLFAFICLLGSALLFQAQFFRWAHGELIPPGMSSRIGSIDGWVKNANAAVPQLGSPLYIWAPHTSHNISDAGMLLYRDEPGGLGKLGLTAVLVAPATGAVLGVVNVDRSPAYAPIFLHGRLWSGSLGLTIVATVSAGSVALLSIGLYLWWPPRKWLVKKLSVRPWRNTFLYAGRLHDWAGAWSLLLLLVVATTGVYMSRSEWLEPVLRLLPGDSHEAHEGVGAATNVPCGSPIGFDQAIGQAQALAAGAALVELQGVRGGAAASRWLLSFQPAGSSAEADATRISVDLSCGTTTVMDRPESRAPRNSAELLLHGLHDGTLFGLPGQIAISLVGLIPLVLFWTGTVRWLRQRAVRVQASGRR